MIPRAVTSVPNRLETEVEKHEITLASNIFPGKIYFQPIQIMDYKSVARTPSYLESLLIASIVHQSKLFIFHQTSKFLAPNRLRNAEINLKFCCPISVFTC